MNLKQKMCSVVLIFSNIYHSPNDQRDADCYTGSSTIRDSRNSVQGTIQFTKISPLLGDHEPQSPIQRHKPPSSPPCQVLGEPPSLTLSDFFSPRSHATDLTYKTALDETTATDKVFFLDLLPSTQEPDTYNTCYDYKYRPKNTYIVAFQSLFQEELYKRHYWEDKMYKLYRIMQDNSADISEDDIEEIRLNAPEIYERYRRQFEEYMSKRVRDKPALLRKSHFILDIGELARGEKSKPVEKKEEKKELRFTSNPRIFDNVFKVTFITDDQEDDASKIEREERIIRDQEEQRAYSEEYERTQKMIRKASGEDMIYDHSTGKRKSIDEYLLSLRLCKPQATRSRRIG